MIGKILKRDLRRNKIITATLFAFIMMAALLVSSAAGIIIELLGSMDSLFKKSSAPHYVQMYSGELNQSAIDKFSAETELVRAQQTVEMININGANLFLGDNETSESNSVIESSFVRQNPLFDFLLDTDSQIIQVTDGEIAVPLYHMQKYALQLGDSIRIDNGHFQMNFTITAFARDAQMNPSLVTSKRFLISDHDWETLKHSMGESEYLIEFLLTDISRTNEFEVLYQSSDLPGTGTTITYSLYQLLNALSDGIIAAVIILISILLIIIAALCLRFTMMSAMEEDYREIGVMKAIGIHSKQIRKLYLTKYIAMAAAACACGYLLSLVLRGIFTANISLYMGSAETSAPGHLIPLTGSAIVFMVIVLFCRLVLRRFRHISAMEALRSGNSQGGGRRHSRIKLYRSRFFNLDMFLGLKEVLDRFPTYGLLCFIFIISSFLVIVPLNFLNTIESSSFITYMGAGKCDVRIDLQKTGDMESRFLDMTAYIEADQEVEKYTTLVTSTFKMLNNDGRYENLKVEIGDFTIFPLAYSSGAAPLQADQIALSTMNANELGKQVGDTVILLVEAKERELTVCGIYQDVTNGGKTAKAILPYHADNILWYIVNINVTDDRLIHDKMEEYAAAFYPAKVNDMDNYISQTLETIITQLRLVVKLAIVVSLAVSILITAMFFKMLIAKEASQISIMRSLGFSIKNIRVQYITRILSVLCTGIIIGTIAAVTLGEKLAGLLLSGVSSIQFAVNPFVSYVLCPAVLIAVVSVTVLISSRTIKKTCSLLLAAE